MFQQFSEPCRQALRLAMLDARKKRAETVDVGHVVLGLLAAPGVASAALRTAGLGERLARAGENASWPGKPSAREATTYSGDAKTAFLRSRGGRTTVDTGHLLVALLEGNPGRLGFPDGETEVRAAVERARVSVREPARRG